MHNANSTSSYTIVSLLSVPKRLQMAQGKPSAAFSSRIHQNAAQAAQACFVVAGDISEYAPFPYSQALFCA
jgi:hypothetical protein